MTDDSVNVIEEASEAIMRMWDKGTLTQARAAFAVFEKAHAPTGDERESNIKKIANLLLESVAAQGMCIVPVPQEPQGEPSDAQVIAAMNALNGYEPPVTDIGYWSQGYVDTMRAALRAAGVVGQEG